MSNINPTVGRVVYYKARGSADGVFPKIDRAAIVTDVKEINFSKSDEAYGVKEHAGGDLREGYACRLAVLNPEGLFFTGWLNQGQEGGEWDWMPFQKDQQARLAKEA